MQSQVKIGTKSPKFNETFELTPVCSFDDTLTFDVQHPKTMGGQELIGKIGMSIREFGLLESPNYEVVKKLQLTNKKSGSVNPELGSLSAKISLLSA